MGCINSKQAKCSPPPSPVSHYLITALPPSTPPQQHHGETSLEKRVGSGFGELEKIKEEPEKEEAVVVRGEEDVTGGGHNLKHELININSSIDNPTKKGNEIVIPTKKDNEIDIPTKKEDETEKKGASFVLRFGRYTQAEQIAAGWPPWLSAVAGEAIDGWLPLKADSFEKLDKVGQGTYSNVYRARDLGRNGKIVALKKVRFDTFQEESVRFMAREIVFLRRLHHPNVMKLEGVITNRLSCSVYLVFEYMEHDLAGLVSCPDIKFTDSHIKCYMKQLLNGLEHCHERGIMHRDIKTSNILLNNDGVLKIADFGLANYTSARQRREPLTSKVVTLWYRPPELLLGSTNYGPSVDLWSVGCVLAELYVGKPILKGRTEVEQLHKIFKLCGSPQSDDFWRKSKLPLASSMFKPQHPYPSTLRERTCKELPKNAIQVLETLLSIEPHKRGNISSIMDSEYFKAKPLPCEPSSLPKYPPNKEIDAKVRDEEARRRIAGIRSRTLETSRNPTRANSNNNNNKALQQTSSISKMENSNPSRRNNSSSGGGRGKERSYDTVSEAASHTTEASRVDSIKSLPIVAPTNGRYEWSTNRKASNSFSSRRGNNNSKPRVIKD